MELKSKLNKRTCLFIRYLKVWKSSSFTALCAYYKVDQPFFKKIQDWIDPESKKLSKRHKRQSEAMEDEDYDKETGIQIV